MNTTSPWRIERLTPGLRDAYLAFFDHERGPAFAQSADHYHGTMSMFENAGFAALAKHDDLTVVRKSLR